MTQENRSTENRLLAALAHASGITQGLGIVVSVVVYVFQREKSRYVAFQALQAAVFQLINLIIVIGIWIVWGIFYSVSIVQIVRLEQTNPGSEPTTFFWVSLGSTVIPLLYMLVTSLYGIWGGVQTWRGRPFRYFVIGPWLERSGLWLK